MLAQPFGPLDGLVRARRPTLLPVVLTPEEVTAVLGHLDGVMWIIVGLLNGSGLRLTECLELRVKDLDFSRNQITVRAEKGPARSRDDAAGSGEGEAGGASRGGAAAA